VGDGRLNCDNKSECGVKREERRRGLIERL